MSPSERQRSELKEQLRKDLRMTTGDQRDRGQSKDEAKTSAGRESGNVALIQDVTGETWRSFWLEGLIQDFKYALRQLRLSPAFALLVLITLALGIGATTAIYSLVDGVLLRPLPLPHPEQLVAIHTVGTGPDSESTWIDTSYPNYIDWRDRNVSFSGLAAVTGDSRLVSRPDGSEGEIARLGRTSLNYFDVLGVTPELGRGFAAGEDKPGSNTVILSYAYWQRTFAKNPHVLGAKLLISSQPFTIIGVMPQNFVEPQREQSDMWVTLAIYFEGNAPRGEVRESGIVDVIGRLKPGVSMQKASADLGAIQSSLAQSYPEIRDQNGVNLQLKLADLTGDLRPALLLLMAAVLALLLIVCTNVAGLMLIRSLKRRGEIALRAALGASRGRIWRQLLIESLLFGISGGVAGIALAYLLLRVALPFVPNNIPRIGEVGINLRVLVFTFVTTLVCAVVSTLYPAWNLAHAQPIDALRGLGQNATSGKSSHRFQSILVVVQTSLGLVLLVASIFLIRSFVNVRNVNTGFKADHLYAFMVPLTASRYPDEKKVRFFDDLLPRLAALPGVHSASGAYPTPLSGSYHEASVEIDGKANPPDHPLTTLVGVVEPGYLETIGCPLLRGRSIKDADNHPNSPLVTVVNEAFAKRYFPGVNPIGRHIRPNLSEAGNQSANVELTADADREVIGVMSDLVQDSLTEAPQPFAVFPYGQAYALMRPTMILRVDGDPMQYENAVRGILRSMDPFLFPNSTRSIAMDVASNSSSQRFETLLISSFAFMAIFLSGLGLYATLSAMVAARSREIGLRIAMGADREDIAGMVLLRAGALVASGLTLGTAFTLVAAHTLQTAGWWRTLLYGVSWFDPQSYAAILLILSLVSVAACLTPVWRAVRVIPMRVLREE